MSEHVLVGFRSNNRSKNSRKYVILSIIIKSYAFIAIMAWPETPVSVSTFMFTVVQ